MSLWSWPMSGVGQFTLTSRPPYCRVDRTANRRSIPVGQRTAVSVARSRCGLRRIVSAASSGDGHSRGANRATIALAESLCRAPHRNNPAGVPGPRIVLNEASLRQILESYFQYYERSRTHLAFEKEAPEGRAFQPPELGVVMKLPEVGGLDHRYEWQAA